MGTVEKSLSVAGSGVPGVESEWGRTRAGFEFVNDVKINLVKFFHALSLVSRVVEENMFVKYDAVSLIYKCMTKIISSTFFLLVSEA